MQSARGHAEGSGFLYQVRVVAPFLFPGLKGYGNRLESYMDVVLLSLTFLFSVIWRIQEGIMVSIVLSLLLVIRKSSKPRISVMVRKLSFCVMS